jgi:hypothetical protein
MTERIAYNMWQREEVYPGKLNGSCNYTRTEYDHLSGYLTKEYTREWTGSDGTRYRKVCQIINLGRPDRGIPVDPDEAMTPEPLEVSKATHASIVARAEQRAARDTVLVERARTYLAQRGACNVEQISNELKVSHTRLRAVMRNHDAMFVFLGGVKALWGLAGESYDEALSLDLAVRTHLTKHGPRTIAQIAKRLGRVPSTIWTLVAKHPEQFCIAGYQERGAHRPVPLWGVVGVHDAA